MLALVDGNNFYVSCERMFRPDLLGRPVVVLSNNDGCAIARSNEAKDIGIKMGAPWFKIRHLEESSGLIGLSANFELYGDMSDRMMTFAAALGHQQEIYSIDECFLDMSGIPGDLVLRSRKIRSRILRATKIPTCIGIAPTKTLAKLANHIAKSAERKPGSYPAQHSQVCHLGAVSSTEFQALLEATEVGEVWGVGRRIESQLREAGINTAWELSQMSPGAARSRWSVVLEKTVRELKGTPCFNFEDQPPPKQQIACTRSFGRPVTDLMALQEAITAFACRAAEKLRQQDSHASVLMAFIRTSPFREQDAQYSGYRMFKMLEPTSDSTALTQGALAVLQAIYRPGFNYAKAGVMLMDLSPASRQQFTLDLGPEPDSSRGRLMSTMDGLNRRYGRGTVTLATAGVASSPKQWSMKQERRTPRYTTRWDELLIVQCR
jgi:DNA polymerase V